MPITIVKTVIHTNGLENHQYNTIKLKYTALFEAMSTR